MFFLRAKVLLKYLVGVVVVLAPEAEIALANAEQVDTDAEVGHGQILDEAGQNAVLRFGQSPAAQDHLRYPNSSRTRQ